MKVLIWSQYFWPETFRVNDVAASLAEAGHEVTVLTGKPNYPEGQYYPGHGFFGVKREQRMGMDLIRIPLINRGRSIARLALNYLSFVAMGYFVAPAALKGKTFDVIFIYAPSPILQALPALFIGKLKRTPTVLWVQDIWPEVLAATGHIRSPFLLRTVARVVRYIYNRSTLILVQSEAFRASVGRLTKDVSKIHYFPNPGEETAAGAEYSEEAKSIARRMDEQFAVVFTGNIGKAQSINTIIETALLLRHQSDICIHLIGSGSVWAWVSEEISRLGLSNIVLTPRLAVTDMPIILSSASVLLATLSDDPVGINTVPSKLQSYLAAGRPIIASMNGEGARIVQDARAGLACPAEDPRRLANSIMELRAATDEQRAQLGSNGRRYFLDNFELKLLSRKLMTLFAIATDKLKETDL